MVMHLILLKNKIIGNTFEEKKISLEILEKECFASFSTDSIAYWCCRIERSTLS